MVIISLIYKNKINDMWLGNDNSFDFGLVRQIIDDQGR